VLRKALRRSGAETGFASIHQSHGLIRKKEKHLLANIKDNKKIFSIEELDGQAVSALSVR
jgi:hypothetical protein